MITQRKTAYDGLPLALPEAVPAFQDEFNQKRLISDQEEKKQGFYVLPKACKEPAVASPGVNFKNEAVNFKISLVISWSES